jgi:hypothetical protein
MTYEESFCIAIVKNNLNPTIMTLFVLYQTDVWKSKSSKVFCGVFDTREKAIDNAKYNGLYTHYSEVIVLEVTLNLFEEA